MLLKDLLRDSLDTATLEYWKREWTATPIRVFTVHLYATGLSLRETEAILHLIGGDRSFQPIFQWVNRLADSVLDPFSA